MDQLNEIARPGNSRKFKLSLNPPIRPHRYVEIDGRQVWRPDSVGFADIPGDPSPAGREAS